MSLGPGLLWAPMGGVFLMSEFSSTPDTKFHRWAKLILDTLAKAAAPLIGLCLSGVVILLAFAHVGLVAFGSQVGAGGNWGVGCRL